jgi:hypothetical protein
VVGPGATGAAAGAVVAGGDAVVVGVVLGTVMVPVKLEPRITVTCFTCGSGTSRAVPT